MKDITESIAQLLRDRLGADYAVRSSSVPDTQPRSQFSNVIYVYYKRSLDITCKLSLQADQIVVAYDLIDARQYLSMSDPELVDQLVRIINPTQSPRHTPA